MKHKTNETHLWHLSKRFFIFSLIEAAFSALKQFFRDSQVNRPNLPFVEICQSFELNLFIHGNKVSISNLSMTKHQTSNENFDSEKNLINSTGRSRLHLNLDRSTVMVDLSVVVVPVFRRHDQQENIYLRLSMYVCTRTSMNGSKRLKISQTSIIFN